MSERTDIDDEEKIDYFIRHLVDPTEIAQERFLCLVVERVRETAVSLAVLGLVTEGTRLLEILHSHGIPPFDLYELGPEKYSEDYDKSCYLAKGDTEKYAISVPPPRPDPFTRAVFAFAWEKTGSWPAWASPGPEPLESDDSDVSPDVEETTLDALERYARLCVCNRFGHTWREDDETLQLVSEMGSKGMNRASPHGPIPQRLRQFWLLWERMLAPWSMNQVVKSTGRALTLDLAVRLTFPQNRQGHGDTRQENDGGEQIPEDNEEEQDEDEVVDEFFLDDDEDAEKEISSEEIKDPEDAHQYNLNYIDSWGKATAENHYAQDQLPMLGCMRRLWQRGWFEHSTTTTNTLVKELDLDVDHIRRVAQTGCDMLTKRLETGPTRPYAGATVAELVRAIDENTRANAPYWPEHNSEEEIAADAGAMERDEDKITRPETLLRRPVPSHQEIADLEQKLELAAPLPEQYRAFLRATNGMGPIWWNETQLIRLLCPIADVGLADSTYWPVPIQLELLPDHHWFHPSIEWPMIRRSVRISQDTSHDGYVLLVEPKFVAEAKAAFFEVYDPLPEGEKGMLRRVVEEVYGSVDAFRKLEWGVVMWTAWFAEMIPYRDFAALLEDFAVGSQRKMRPWSRYWYPGIRKLNSYYYFPQNECNEDGEEGTVDIGKGNLLVHEDGTMSMGENVYPDNEFTRPEVFH
ncbi:hypothetical protein RB213_009455 [Colletotrichum asianum]|uniref:Knr4/Smi1-like domain-containing protein n=1 Tax=Colletotrichum asianum TaxID=702518 RepID=A0A8H3W4Q4_9PEZI|nr:hypothetical protein GQ607_011613 [Colletotrichum asianum]